MENFENFNLPERVQHRLETLGFEKPTPIQQKAIPLALEGRDILGSAQTGTGKTAAFAIPLVVKMLNNPSDMAVVITPTRELASQVHKAILGLISKKSKLLCGLLIGGESMQKQLTHLRRKPQIIIGTPGRINDHLQRRSLKLDRTSYLVLDETDRMLDMGFAVQIDKIVKQMPDERQTMLFSATLPANIIKLSKSYLTNPERVAIGSVTDPAKNIKQEIVHLSQNEKLTKLYEELNTRQGSIIVFVKSKFNADKMAKRLREQDHKVEAMHGDLRHNKRERVLKNFRAKNIRILVATDIAARGLDVPHIEHVINFDLPQSPEDYIHRIGRTARAGAEGEALCFVAPADNEKWFAIQKMMNPDAKIERPARPGGQKPQGRKRSFSKKKNQSAGFKFKQHSRKDKKADNTDARGTDARGKSDRPNSNRSSAPRNKSRRRRAA